MKNESNTIQDLANQVNSYDQFYMMIDNHADYIKGENIEIDLKAAANALGQNDRLELLSLLNEEGLKSIIGKALTAYAANLPKPAPKKSKLSRIMSTAWDYMRKGIFATFSECLKASWKAYKIIKALKNGIVSFTYRKATGQIRQATGTLNKSLYTFTGKGNRSESKPDAIKYYDTEKDAWRMFRIERLLEVAA